MAEKIAAAKNTTVAVVDFADLQGQVTELGRFFAEEFSVALAGTAQDFEVIDRAHLAPGGGRVLTLSPPYLNPHRLRRPTGKSQERCPTATPP